MPDKRYQEPDPEVLAIGERMRARREALHITQEELGFMIGADKVAVHRYESGKVQMKGVTIKRVAKSLMMTTDELLFGYQQDVPKVDPRILESLRCASPLDNSAVEHICWILDLNSKGAMEKREVVNL